MEGAANLYFTVYTLYIPVLGIYGLDSVDGC